MPILVFLCCQRFADLPGHQASSAWHAACCKPSADHTTGALGAGTHESPSSSTSPLSGTAAREQQGAQQQQQAQQQQAHHHHQGRLPTRPEIQILALDLDGTLLDSRSKVLPSSVAAIKAAIARGVTVMLATGKARPAAIRAMQAVGLAGEGLVVSTRGPGVFLQGLAAYGRGGALVAGAQLDEEVVRRAFEYSLEHGIPLCGFLGEECVTLEMAPELEELHHRQAVGALGWGSVHASCTACRLWAAQVRARAQRRPSAAGTAVPLLGLLPSGPAECALQQVETPVAISNGLE